MADDGVRRKSAIVARLEGADSRHRSFVETLLAQIIDQGEKGLSGQDTATRLAEAAEGLRIPFSRLQEIQNVAFVKANIDAGSFTSLLEKMNKDLGDAEQKGGPAAESLDYIPIPTSVVELIKKTWADNVKGADGKALVN